MKFNILKISFILSALFLAGCSHSLYIQSISEQAQYSKVRTPENFDDYVNFLKGKAAAQGVSLSLLNAQQNIH